VIDNRLTTQFGCAAAQHYRQHTLSIIRKRYANFGPTQACEKLAELHDFILAIETVRKLMTHERIMGPA